VAGRFFGGKHATCELPKSMDGCAFFPAEGYRHYTNGTIDTQAAALHAWSGTQVDAGYGYNLGFNSTKGDPANNADKAYGLSVRCVRNAP
jgi:hypothetical protein